MFYHSIVDVTEPKQLSEMLWPMAVQMRPSQALRLWQQVALAEVRADVPDLTMRQLAILLVVYLDPPPHTVRGLAEKLNVTKPVITRALDTMGAMKLVSRHRDERDKRNVLVKRTVEGALFSARRWRSKRRVAFVRMHRKFPKRCGRSSKNSAPASSA